ncbi:hypothetical protein BUALT_Bualt08G0089600 [Buddleja alternifolia]|uniref:protein-disulfide reductase n=1 Tax=Buddleja alternifolia TaxID=168488 RepID=A0AAV6XCX6_9LAMI|nr:hypothetical protein BUALT_Bualt08G0089600 [Buddleja alternifolia]
MKQEEEVVKSNQKGDIVVDDDGYGSLWRDCGWFVLFFLYLEISHCLFLRQVKISNLKGKIVGIYFSANWYPPCQNFTRVLANAYDQLKNSNPGFEIVFVSSDEDLNSFNNYRALMPWLAIPFSDLDTKRALNLRYNIEGIPCLIVLQPDDSVEDLIIEDGVDLIYRYGVQAYPFTRQRLEELVEKEKHEHDNQTLEGLLTNHGRDFLMGNSMPKQVPVTSLTSKTIGLYFSAEWCSPAAKFTPKLVSVYQKINQQLTINGHHNFEIVFVSSDHDQTSFESYFQTMPWLALPYGDPNIKNLTKYFDVRGIPSLVILGPDRKTVTKQGRSLVNLYQERAYPFTEDRKRLLEREMDEEARKLAKFEYHSGHCHELMLVSEGNGGGPFICCDCDEQGSGWAYQCVECGYEVHTKCVNRVERGSINGS